MPGPMGAGHHVQIVGVVARGCAEGMVAPGDQEDIAIGRSEGRVQCPVSAVDTREAPTARPLEAVVIQLLEVGLTGWVLGIVLVGRVARPVASGREHLEQDQPAGRRRGRQQVMDAPLRYAVPPCLHVQLARLEEVGHTGVRSRRIGHDDGGAVTLGGQRHLAARLEQQHGRRRAIEDALATPQRGIVPAAGADVSTALQDDDDDLAVVSRSREALAPSQPMLGEADVRPAGVVSADGVHAAGLRVRWTGAAQQSLRNARCTWPHHRLRCRRTCCHPVVPSAREHGRRPEWLTCTPGRLNHTTVA